jgi:hypothetical protein
MMCIAEVLEHLKRLKSISSFPLMKMLSSLNEIILKRNITY